MRALQPDLLSPPLGPAPPPPFLRSNARLQVARLPINTGPLRWCIAILQRGMRSCHHRQAYLQLAARKYSPALQPVHLAEFAGEITAGRDMRLDVGAAVVMLDPTLCALILDNAISNAFKHGDPDAPDVAFRASAAAVPGEAGRVRLAFAVTNRAHPARPPLTPEYVDGILRGHPGPAGRAAARSAMSDQIGLQHSYLAAQVVPEGSEEPPPPPPPPPPASAPQGTHSVGVWDAQGSSIGYRGGRGGSGRQKAATQRNMRREERVTVQGPVKEQQPDGMSHRGRGQGSAVWTLNALTTPTRRRWRNGNGGVKTAAWRTCRRRSTPASCGDE